MKKTIITLFVLAALTSWGLATQAVAGNCATTGLRCTNEGSNCTARSGREGKCTQVVRDGSNLPNGCHCNSNVTLFAPKDRFPMFGGLTLNEAYRVRDSLDAIQGNLDEHIISLETESESQPDREN